MNRQEFEYGEQDYRYIRTTCGLIGFIVFFMGAFFAFIIAGETGYSYQITVISGFIMLGLTLVFFCCVMKESKRVSILTIQSGTLEMDPLIELQPLGKFRPDAELPPVPQPEAELPLEPQQEPHWGDKSRHDSKYLRGMLGLPAGDSDETVDSENDLDPDIQELKKMTKSKAETSGNLYSNEPSSSQFVDVDLHSPEEEIPKVADSSEVTESKYDILALKGMFAPSLSDSTKGDSVSVEKQTENVSASLSKLSLDGSEKQGTEMAKEDSSAIDSEGKSDKGRVSEC